MVRTAVVMYISCPKGGQKHDTYISQVYALQAETPAISSDANAAAWYVPADCAVYAHDQYLFYASIIFRSWLHDSFCLVTNNEAISDNVRLDVVSRMDASERAAQHLQVIFNLYIPSSFNLFY